MSRETTPLVGGGPGPPLLVQHISRRLSALQPVALRRNSMRDTEDVIPAMGKLGSFLVLSNLITGALQPRSLGLPLARALWAPPGRAWRRIARRRARCVASGRPACCVGRGYYY